MRRKIYAIGLIAAAVALVAIVFGVASRRSLNADNPMSEGAGDAQVISSISASVDEIGEAHSPQQRLGADPDPATVKDPSGSENVPCLDHAETARVAKRVREEGTREVTNVYSLLLERLDLTISERNALLALLIEIRIAATHTACVRGKSIDQQERSEKIAAIIGDAKLRQFLSLERHLGQYSEVLYMQAVLQKYEVPMTEAERDRMLEILIEIQNQDLMVPGADAERDSIEYLEYRLARMDERERLVFEQAASVLSAEQVEHLFAQYQLESYRRAGAVERQKKARAQGDESLPLHYPGRRNPEDP